MALEEAVVVALVETVVVKSTAVVRARVGMSVGVKGGRGVSCCSVSLPDPCDLTP